MIAAIIPAAGSGTRTGLKENKIFFEINGTPIIKLAVEKFLKHPLIDDVFVVCAPSDKERLNALLGDTVHYVLGGATRGQSVCNGLAALNGVYDRVLIHDGARPFVDESTVTAVVKAIGRGVGAVAGVRITDTVKAVDDSLTVTATPDRSLLWAAQTPQGFFTDEIVKAYALAGDKQYTDDAAVYERFGGSVVMCEGSYANKKITTAEDVKMAEEFYSGIGYDVHRLTEGRKLILGGVEIDYSLGLLGHSDADVLLHAISDALLGAASLGDIGRHFPDTDERYKGISSIILLREVASLVAQKGFRIVNVSAIVVAQRPKLKDYIPMMNENIAKALNIDVSRVNVAATTTEKLGFEGRGEGISSSATVMLKR